MEETQSNQESGIPVPYQTMKPKKVKRTDNSWYYLGAAGQIGFVIAIPIAGGALLGSYLDTRFGTYPTYTAWLLFGGIVLSIVNFIVTIKTILKKQT